MRALLTTAVVAVCLAALASVALAGPSDATAPPVSQKCAMGTMEKSTARNTALVTLQTYENNQLVNMGMGLNLRVYHGDSPGATN